MAWVVSRMKDNYLSAFYHRIARRRGKKRAIIAVAHKILVMIYHMLKNNKPYEDLGADYFDRLDAAQIERRADKPLEQLGYDVTLTPLQLPDQTEKSPPDKTTKKSSSKTTKKPSSKTTKSPPDITAKQPPKKTAKKKEVASLQNV